MIDTITVDEQIDKAEFLKFLNSQQEAIIQSVGGNHGEDENLESPFSWLWVHSYFMGGRLFYRRVDFIYNDRTPSTRILIMIVGSCYMIFVLYRILYNLAQ